MKFSKAALQSKVTATASPMALKMDDSTNRTVVPKKHLASPTSTPTSRTIEPDDAYSLENYLSEVVRCEHTIFSLTNLMNDLKRELRNLGAPNVKPPVLEPFSFAKSWVGRFFAWALLFGGGWGLFFGTVYGNRDALMIVTGAAMCTGHILVTTIGASRRQRKVSESNIRLRSQYEKDLREDNARIAREKSRAPCSKKFLYQKKCCVKQRSCFHGCTT
jgi:hypothetical protein